MKALNEAPFLELMQAQVAPGDRVLAAVSGGADSMAMLDLLLRFKSKLGCDVEVVHVHHHLRAASDEEWRFLERYCAERGVPFHGCHVQVRAACAKGESLEACAHRLRHAAFRDVAAASGAQWLALAHQADDRAETVLMNILRGCALSGLAAMPARDGWLLRPLLAYRKAELEAYCQTQHIPYVCDESNADTTILRNRLRHVLLPELAAYNPQITSALGRLAESSESVLDHLRQEAQAIYDDACVLDAAHWCLLDRTVLSAAHAAVRDTLVHQLAQRFSSGRSSLRHDMVTACGERLHAGSGRVDLGQGLLFETSRRWCYIGQQPQGTWHRENDRWRQDFLDAEVCVPAHIAVRTWQSGDAIALKNLGHKSLKKIFQETALPSCLRAVWPVIYDTKIKEIICLPFLASERKLMYYNSVTYLKDALSVRIAQQTVRPALTQNNKDK